MKEHEERMAFRLPAAEAEQIRASASALGVPVSEWIRRAVAERLRVHDAWLLVTGGKDND